MCHRGGTETCFVGEDAAGHTLLDGGLDHDAGSAAEGSVRAEGALEDHAEHGAKASDVGDDNDEGSYNIDDSHEGNQLFCDGADSLDAAQKHQGDDHSDDNTDDNAGDRYGLAEHLHGIGLHVAAEGVNGGVDGGSYGIDLGHVSDTEGSEETEDAEDGAKPRPALSEAVLDVVHRAADPVALVISLAVIHRQDNLGIFGGHAEESGDPHPEDCAGAACGDGAGDAGDVAGTDGCSKGCGYRLERGDLTVSCILLLEHLSQGVFHGIAKTGKLDEAHAGAEENAGADKQDQHPGTPRDSVQEINKIRKSFHN